MLSDDLKLMGNIYTHLRSRLCIMKSRRHLSGVATLRARAPPDAVTPEQAVQDRSSM